MNKINVTICNESFIKSRWESFIANINPDSSGDNDDVLSSLSVMVTGSFDFFEVAAIKRISHKFHVIKSGLSNENEHNCPLLALYNSVYADDDIRESYKISNIIPLSAYDNEIQAILTTEGLKKIIKNNIILLFADKIGVDENGKIPLMTTFNLDKMIGNLTAMLKGYLQLETCRYTRPYTPAKSKFLYNTYFKYLNIDNPLNSTAELSEMSGSQVYINFYGPTKNELMEMINQSKHTGDSFGMTYTLTLHSTISTFVQLLSFDNIEFIGSEEWVNVMNSAIMLSEEILSKYQIRLVEALSKYREYLKNRYLENSTSTSSISIKTYENYLCMNELLSGQMITYTIKIKDKAVFEEISNSACYDIIEPSNKILKTINSIEKMISQ